MNLATLNIKLPDQLLIFDGVCNFCNSSVNFIIQRDQHAKIHFTQAQSKLGQLILEELNLDANAPTTMVFVKHRQVFLHSDAALEISRDLSGLWSWLYYLKFIPGSLRDLIYRQIARHRYALMGKRQTCMIPSDEIKNRFVD